MRYNGFSTAAKHVQKWTDANRLERADMNFAQVDALVVKDHRHRQGRKRRATLLQAAFAP